MRRFFGFCVLCVSPLAAQDAVTENPTLSALMTEVRELRLAIERSTLLGARTQISILRIQMQEERVARTSQALEAVRQELVREQAERVQFGLVLKDMEAQLSRASDPERRRELENEIQGLKRRVSDGAQEVQIRAREGEAFRQFQAEQSRLTQLHAEMSQLETALDTAIRQVTPR